AAPARADPLRVPVRVEGSRVLVDCTLDGKGPWPFVLDTGGTIGLLSMKMAKGLGLDYLGDTRLSLAVGKLAYPVYKVTDLSFGGAVRQGEAAFAGVRDFNFGQGAVGSLAAGVLSTLPSELDLAAGEWRVYRDTAPDRTGWVRYDKAILASRNRYGSSFLQADIDLGGEPCRCLLDTGMPGALRLYRKAAQKAGLSWDAPRWTPAPPYGTARMMRAPELALAGVDLKGLIVELREEADFPVAENGIVGLPILRFFALATDPAEKAVFLRFNPAGAAPRQRDYNRAGFWVEREGKGKDVKVAVVGAASPAEAAGIAPGDRLVGADFDRLVKAVYEPAGTRLALVVERAGARRAVDLVLENFL
ncbi:aspartyl protease family protein, partial [Novosphingobium sp. 1949]